MAYNVLKQDNSVDHYVVIARQTDFIRVATATSIPGRNDSEL